MQSLHQVVLRFLVIAKSAVVGTSSGFVTQFQFILWIIHSASVVCVIEWRDAVQTIDITIVITIHVYINGSSHLNVAAGSDVGKACHAPTVKLVISWLYNRNYCLLLVYIMISLLGLGCIENT